MDEHGIKFKSEVTKYHHGFTGPVDIVFKNITKRLFKKMDAQELRNPKETSTLWVRFLQKEVEYHNTKVKMGTSPAKAMKLEKVVPKKPRKPRKERLLPEDGLYRYLLKPGEEHSDSKTRATDKSRMTYRLSDIEQISDQRVIYYLQSGPKRAFVREELMLIPETTEIPLESVMKW